MALVTIHNDFGAQENQILYVYTVEVKNKFKGLDLIDRVPEEVWMELCNTASGGIDQNYFKEK